MEIYSVIITVAFLLSITYWAYSYIDNYLESSLCRIQKEMNKTCNMNFDQVLSDMKQNDKYFIDEQLNARLQEIEYMIKSLEFGQSEDAKRLTNLESDIFQLKFPIRLKAEKEPLANKKEEPSGPIRVIMPDVPMTDVPKSNGKKNNEERRSDANTGKD